jgi:hypothetical protein
LTQSRDISELTRSLERWVALQKIVLDNFKQIDSRVRTSDRLDIIIHTRLAFNHMIRTLKAFDDWLQDPFITSNIPRELLLEVWSTSLKLMETLLELDIKHTTEVKNLIEKAVKEGQISPVIAQLRDLAAPRGEERERRGPAISI